MQTQIKKFALRVAVALAAVVTLLPNCAHAGLAGTTTEDATLTQYDGDQIAVKIHADRVFPDHEKWGFFRVSVLPLAVVQGARVQISSAAHLTNALRALNSLNFPTRAARRVELRQVEISLLEEKDSRLRAALARIQSAGVLELSGVSLGASLGVSNPISKATLQISGPSAGLLRWRDGEKERELFILQPPEKPRP